MNKPMFYEGQTYTHKRMLDAVIKVILSTPLENGGYRLVITSMNNRGLYLGITEEITVKKEEVRNWIQF